MNIKETYLKIDELQSLAHILSEKLKVAVIQYMKDNFEVESCQDPDNNSAGKICLEEISAFYDSKKDLVCIEFSKFLPYKDIGECDNKIYVSPSVLDKYLK